MTDDQAKADETDGRFPSGQWTGFFLQPPYVQGRAKMELALEFGQGLIRGQGDDFVGEFLLCGHYDLDSGDVSINKRYVGQHDVFYKGFAEHGKGIWGVWSINDSTRGGWHIWPKGMADPTGPELHEKNDLPIEEVASMGARSWVSEGTGILLCHAR